ncbi:hypothetical protein BS47DRAFT_1367859 [Hydnum rufescens UP504]|uniref:Uncharacterized protein n=1 Tax=Hydnum rufescens UP504 TaxID=1448309 RepID=A0A9P6AHD7_9AGAM|nr:hypothetical protein BS47DRAFT_1367859 [Hydnum rufescens UP504]
MSSDSPNQTALEGQGPHEAKSPAHLQIYNPSPYNYIPLWVFGYALNMEEMFAWQEKHDPQEKTFDDYHSSYPTLKEIERRLYGKPTLLSTWEVVKHPIDKQVAFCFTIGSNRNQAGLENAKNRLRIRKVQKVLGIEKDVKPRWYKVVKDP